MQDPSYGVPQFLLPHVHLLSSFRYPTLATLSLESAVDYLLQAPKIVKELAPMAWTYIHHPPPDGTVLLAWQPPSHPQSRFSSDGYVWAGPESTLRYEVRGYTVEILVHRSGYRPGAENVATHARHRFRIMSRNPGATGPVHDPSLWVIHYSQSEPQYRVPANRIPIQPETQKIMQERRWLENQGQLARKEFMLHDRYNWPTINFPPSGQVPGSGLPAAALHGVNAAQMAAMGRPAQYYTQGPVGAVGPSPAKRARQGPPPALAGPGGIMPPPIAGMTRDTSIEDEENTALGDLLDNLTPQEISKMRFVQHHEWLEEVFSSPYAAGKIAPIDLGLGLMGELAHLTEGILDAPGSQPTKDGPKSSGKSPRYQKLQPAQLSKFEERVAAYVKEGQAGLAQMKKEHAERLADLSRSKLYTQAESRLRDAVWEHSSGSIIDAERPTAASSEVSGSAGPEESQRPEITVEAIIREVERSMGITIKPQPDVICVDKGGLIEEEKDEADNNEKPVSNAAQPVDRGVNGVPQDVTANGEIASTGLLDQFTTNSFHSTPAPDATTVPAATSMGQVQPPMDAPSGAASEQVESAPFTTDNDQQEPQVGATDETLMDGVDLDVDMEGIEQVVEEQPMESDWVMVDQSGEGNEGGEGGPDASSYAAPETAQPSDANPPSTEQPAAETAGVFDNSEFENFANIDTPGEGLVDYSGGADDLGMDLETSAFGDAFHETATPQAEAEGTTGVAGDASVS